jgi:hypothetical protein
MIALQYIYNEEKRYHVFVANRVAEIRRCSQFGQWRHVSGQDNPADDISRGMKAKELVASERWLNGPQFLQESESSWPAQPSQDDLKLESSAEIKKEKRIYSTVTDEECQPLCTLIQKTSSWHKLKRIMSWILRFRDKLKKRPVQRGGLVLTELQAAEAVIIRYVQRTSIPEKSIQKLCPIERDGVWRVGGRLAQSRLDYEMKHPVILPWHHPVTALIGRAYHQILGHCGAERLLAEMRSRYWPIGGHSFAKSVVQSCVVCKRIIAPPEQQKMSDLPEDRIISGERPFTRVGVDYFGPMLVKRARSRVKRYGCVFTCLVTRAIHIEVSSELSTDSFLQALQRFMARRGRPSVIRSDNGTNFVGGERELRECLESWNQEKIRDQLMQENISWTFNTPTASHMGGVWERMVRSIRQVLLGLTREQTVDEETLGTLMCRVESILNGRPITKLSEDPSDPRPLSPSDLLIQGGSCELPLAVVDLKDQYRRRWKQVEYLMFFGRDGAMNICRHYRLETNGQRPGVTSRSETL